MFRALNKSEFKLFSKRLKFYSAQINAKVKPLYTDTAMIFTRVKPLYRHGHDIYQVKPLYRYGHDIYQG